MIHLYYDSDNGCWAQDDGVYRATSVAGRLRDVFVAQKGSLCLLLEGEMLWHKAEAAPYAVEGPYTYRSEGGADRMVMLHVPKADAPAILEEILSIHKSRYGDMLRFGAADSTMRVGTSPSQLRRVRMMHYVVSEGRSSWTAAQAKVTVRSVDMAVRILARRLGTEDD